MDDVKERRSDVRFVATLDYLRKLCSTREYCRRDVYDKALKRLEGDADAAALVVEALVKEKFVDERRYAAAFARDKSSIQGWGPLKIRMSLVTKGIPSNVISEAVEAIDGEKADAKLVKSLETKAKQLSGDPQIRLKLLRFALGRGYEYDTAFRAVNSLLR